YGYKPGDEDDITYIMKIDPVDGSVVNYKDYSSLSDFPALIPLPSGEMMVLMSDDEKFNKLSADAQTFSSYCDGTVFYHEGYPDVDSDHVSLIGTIGLSESIEDGTLSLVNFAENSIIGTPAVFLDETVFPASICGASE